MNTLNKIIRALREEDKIVVIPTDTIYGVAASALSKKAVERTYGLLKRNSRKPCIILISSLKDLALFKVKIDKLTKNTLGNMWPGKVSVVLPVTSEEFRYLHRGKQTLAFRVPKNPMLRKLLQKTGPLISSSANPEGEEPALTIRQAKKYFGDKIDFYCDAGRISSQPSTLIEIKRGKVRVLRKGIAKISNIQCSLNIEC